MLEFHNKVAGLQAYNFIKKRLQHKSFLVNIGKFLRAPILKNIWERLLLNELNALLTSTKIKFIHNVHWMINCFDPASCPAQTCCVPVHLMSSSFRTETITLPVILRKTSPTPMGRSQGFLTDGFKRHDRKASTVRVSTRSIHKFQTRIANALRRSLLDFPKLLEARILRQPSASIPEEPEPPSNCYLSYHFFVDWFELDRMNVLQRTF